MTRTIDDIPGDRVAERLCRKLRSRVPGFLMTTSRNDKPAKVITARRVLSIYYGGSIEQSITAYEWSCGSMSVDPHAFTSQRNRDHAIYLHEAGRYRRNGDLHKARTTLAVARSIRTREPVQKYDERLAKPAFVQAAE